MAFESVDEVGGGVGDSGNVATQDDESGDGDEDECQDFNNPNTIRKPVREAGVEGDDWVLLVSRYADTTGQEKGD